jgi:hypothetical protein
LKTLNGEGTGSENFTIEDDIYREKDTKCFADLKKKYEEDLETEIEINLPRTQKKVDM